MSAYLTVEQADVIVKQLYVSNDTSRIFWEGLSPDDKAVLLSNATKLIDNKRCLWKGRKYDVKQEHQFPRITYRGIKCTIAEIDDSFLQGIVELAIELEQYKHSEEFKLMQNGVSSYKVKDASISFSGATENNVLGIPKDIWDTYFAQWSDIC